MVQLYNDDCMKVMTTLKDKSIDMVCTDIPYAECDKDSNGLRTIDKQKANTLTFDLHSFLKEVDRICRGVVVIFCGMEQFSPIFQFFNMGGQYQVYRMEKAKPLPDERGTRLSFRCRTMCMA